MQRIAGSRLFGFLLGPSASLSGRHTVYMHAVKEAFVVIRAVLTDQLIADAAAGLLLDELRRGVREAVDRLEGAERRAVQLCQLEARSYPSLPPSR